MKKFVNVRLPFILACFLAAGVAAGYLFVFKVVNLLWIIAVIPVTAIIFILCLLLVKKNFLVIAIPLCALFFILGTVSCYSRLYAYKKSDIVGGAVYTVTATVYEKGENARGEYLILKSIRADGERVDGRIIAYLVGAYGDFCDAGYKVSFTAKLDKLDAFPYGELNYYAQENVKYSCTVYCGLTAKYGYSFFGSIRSAIRDTLYNNLDKDTAAIALAMLTGDTQGVEDGAMTNFRYGGIAHIFAVSGLHIGIVYGIFRFLGKKFKLNKYAAAALCLLPVFLYTGICGFTLSSVRAAVMCTVSVLAGLIYKKYDGLNALSVAVVLILLIMPLSLFSVGFQLSACAVLGILLLTKRFAKTFKKLPRKVVNATGAALSAQAAATPVMLASFGYLSGAGLIMNIILVPLLSAIFIVLFLSTLVSAAIPYAAAFILPYTALPLKAVISFLVDSGFENSLISGFGAGAFAVIYFIGLTALSDKLNLKLMYRLIAVGCAFAVLCTYVLLKTFAPFSGFKIVVSAYYGCGEALIKSHGGNVLIVTEGLNASHAQKTLNNYYAADLSAVIILGGENCAAGLDVSLLNCENIYVYGGYIPLQPYDNIRVIYEDNFELCGTRFSFADGYSLLADCGGVNIAVCAGDFIPYENCDLIVTDYPEAANNYYAVGFNERRIDCNVYDCGNIEFYVNDGKLEKIG